MIEGDFIYLNFRQLVALIDLHTGYGMHIGEETPANDGRTRAALVRKNLWSNESAALTPRGRAYLEAAEWDVGYYSRRRRVRRAA